MRTEPAVATVSVIDHTRTDREAFGPLITRGGWQPSFFASAEELLAAPCEAVPSCLLLDLHLPGIGGLGLQSLLAQRPELSIIFITDHIDLPVIVRALKAGAVDVLARPLVADTVSVSITAALEHSRQLLRRKAELEKVQKRYTTLSNREREVMALVVSGCLNKQVGAQLSISIITVKAHRGRVMRKMAAESLPHLVRISNDLEITPVAPRAHQRGPTASQVPMFAA
jgi:FixJ family two-component response regulator